MQAFDTSMRSHNIQFSVWHGTRLSFMICPATEASSQAWLLHYDTLKQKSHLKFGKRGGGVLSFVSAVSSMVREAVSAATFEAEGCVVREAVSTTAFEVEGSGVDGGKERGEVRRERRRRCCVASRFGFFGFVSGSGFFFRCPFYEDG
nr:hypothetical protein Itr_chr14CG11270 [Ipomoea trifida]